MKIAEKVNLLQEIQSDLSSDVRYTYQSHVKFMPFDGEEIVKWKDVKNLVEKIANDIQRRIYSKS